jgi:hypothetical protein
MNLFRLAIDAARLLIVAQRFPIFVVQLSLSILAQLLGFITTFLASRLDEAEYQAVDLPPKGPQKAHARTKVHLLLNR